MGVTCTFSESGTTVAKFCDNGCCDNQCCTDTSFDSKALAIAIAVILAILLIAALIILIIYCWKKRSKRGKNKTDWRHKDVALADMQSGNDQNRTVANGHPAGYSGLFFKANKLIQTGNPNLEPRDHLLWGRARRWSSIPTSKSRPPRKIWNLTKRPVDGFSQTSDDDVLHYKQLPVHNSDYRDELSTQRSSIIQSPFLSEITEQEEKGVQTTAPKYNHYDPNKSNTGRKKQYLASWTPVAPWRPSAQHKSLTKSTPKPLNTNTDFSHTEIEPYYPIHRCPPDSSLYSEHSGNKSAAQSRSNEFDSNS